MAIVEGWLPPSRENWELLINIFKFFPVITILQWVTAWYPQGKTSYASRFNLPGKVGWAAMEVPGFLTVLYLMFTLPEQQGIKSLPTANWLMAGLFTIHYIYRAILAPLVLAPSMAPIHVVVWASATGFQLINGACIGGWLAGYGPTTAKDWQGHTPWIQFGVVVFFAGFIGNIIHDDELRAIRRRAAAKQNAAQEKDSDKKSKKNERVYEIPSGGLFEYVLYPHYFCEWVEWLGYWMIGGWSFVPGQSFFISEIATMMPRAIQGRQWYIHRFGEAKIKDKKAVVPGLI